MDASLERRLAEVDQPRSHCDELTGQTLAMRLYGSASLHRLVPTPVALRLAALRGRLEWHLVPRRREEALRYTEGMRGVRDRVYARRRLVEDAVRAELQWRRWLFRRVAVEGFEHFTAARDRGRGVVVTTVHVGPTLVPIHALAARGVRVYVPGGDYGEPGRRAGLHGRWIATQNRWVEEAGCRWIPLGGSYDVVRELLRRGETVYMPADAFGSHDVILAARPARVRSGLASLSLETGAPVVPAWTLRRGYRFVTTFAPAIDPASAGDRAALMQRVADTVSGPLLAEPEQAHPFVLDAWTDDTAARNRRPAARDVPLR